MSLSPFTSFPFTFGHENAGRVDYERGEQVNGLQTGQRVVVNPMLSCRVRGFDDLCNRCSEGRPNLCLRQHLGRISPGTLTGFCRDTGGSWSSSFVAHASQVIPLPDSVSDEAAVMSEPFAITLHAVLRTRPSDDQTVLIMGSGVMGMLTVAALRATGHQCRILITARHPFQQEMARSLGADDVISPKRGAAFLKQIAERTGAEILRPVIGKKVVSGGVDVVYECVGSDETLDDALRLTRPGGSVVVLGMAAVPRGVDWTPVYFHEVDIIGAYAYPVVTFEGQSMTTMELAVQLVADGRVDLTPFVTHQFSLHDYRTAFETVANKGQSGVVRAVFAFDPAES